MGAALETEICVIGGGPAGATVGARLAALGHDVTIVDRGRRCGPEVGEALSPGIWHVLDLVGARDAVGALDFRPLTRSKVLWGEEPRFSRRENPPGLMVDRTAFDASLRSRARDLGARVLAPASAGRPVRVAGSAPWHVQVRMQGEVREIRARFLVDATGRSGRLGGRRVRDGAATVALHASWAREGGWGSDTWIEAGDDEWIWAALGPTGTLRVMVFLAASRCRESRSRGVGLPDLYRDALDRARLASELDGGRILGSVRACDAGSWHHVLPMGEDWIRVGEASFTLDPLSSTGVQAAIQTSWMGAAAVHTALMRPEHAEVAREFYAEEQRRTVERHVRWAESLYAEAHPEPAGRAFWKERSAPGLGRRDGVPAHAPFPMPSAPVGLSSDAVVAGRPCLIGDFVETRRTLICPGEPRPILSLGGVEVAPLLDGVAGAASIGELESVWARVMPRPKARSILEWMVRRGVLVSTARQPVASAPPRT